MDIYDKYNKYCLLTGGKKNIKKTKKPNNNNNNNNNNDNDNDNDTNNKIKNIIKLLKKSTKTDIQNSLMNEIKYDKYCQKIIGEGQFGKVFVPQINKTIEFNKKKFDIIIKESHATNQPSQNFEINLLDNILYISGYNTMTTELLILMFIKMLWDKTVNLPLLFAYGTCKNTGFVDTIITLKYGLKGNPITIDLKDKIYNDGPLWGPRDDVKQSFTSNIETLSSLFSYIHYSKKSDGTVILPNGIICDDISKLYDMICISYFATYHLLTENNIYPKDMHEYNIFIHWLNSNSFYGQKPIKNLKEIVYKIGKKNYKIQTYGFVIILGDVGVFNVVVQDDVIILGQGYDIKKNYKLIEQQLNPNYGNMEFIDYTHQMLTPNEYKKTVACEIMGSEPYCSYPMRPWHLLGKDITFLNEQKSTPELLEFYYAKYGIKKYEKHENNILIDVKKYF